MQWYGMTCGISYPLPFPQRNATQWYATICIIAHPCVCFACAWAGNHIESIHSESIRNETIWEQMIICDRLFLQKNLGRRKTSAENGISSRPDFLHTRTWFLKHQPATLFWAPNGSLLGIHMFFSTPTGMNQDMANFTRGYLKDIFFIKSLKALQRT